MSPIMRSEGKTYQQIADEMGYKSKTTIINMYKKIEKNDGQSVILPM